MNPRDYIYDIETYPNCFTFAAKHVATGQRYLFEYSFRRNDLGELLKFLKYLDLNNCRLVGYNNIHFDYPVVHFIIQNFPIGPGYLTPYRIYEMAMSIINAPDHARFDHMVWDNEMYVAQVDLFKIHHFDNAARRTSLKLLEFNMKLDNIADLPFDVGTFLDSDQIDTLVHYNMYGDVDATEKFYLETLKMIEFREELSEKYGKNFLNFSDKKIGSEILILELEKNAPGTCYTRENGYREKRQTFRPFIDLANVIFPYINFEQPEFNRVKNWLFNQTITETKGIFKDLSCTIDGFQFDFGTGGIHGSVDSCIVESNDERVIIDLDVASYYPNIGIKNRIYPQHLGEKFCDIYEDIFLQRKQYPKSNPLNGALKLALNGAYGDSNNVYSPFLDPQYTMAITINGQLMLCMLAEQLMKIPDLKMIQINTDGLTVLCPRSHTESVNRIRAEWEELTKLELEEARYSRMFIRDVNNYIAEYEDGKLKRKGAYSYVTPLTDPSTQEKPWHKNHSALVVAKAAEAALVRGADIREFITGHNDVMDFMLRVKVPRSNRLDITYPEIWGDTKFPLQKITRYFVSNDGGELKKTMPPCMRKAYIFLDLQGRECYAFNKPDAKPFQKAGYTYLGQEKRLTGERVNGVSVGWKVTPCNDIKEIGNGILNYEYYIQETDKLVNKLKGIPA